VERITQLLFSRETLHVSWQSIELVPETPMRSRRHGISRVRPALISSSTSRNITLHLLIPLVIFPTVQPRRELGAFFKQEMFDGSLNLG
jgi:hypothetical protein